MRCLLDTHVLLWWLTEDKALSQTSLELIGDPENAIFVSAASAWEIAVKFAKGKLPQARLLLADFSSLLAEEGFVDLPITCAQMIGSTRLPGDHKDPFDRILAAQAILENMTLISIDPEMSSLGATTRW
jgi:PIN domain nuclease of toxin-antitoxin system